MVIGLNDMLRQNYKHTKVPNHNFYYANEFWYSSAYQSLTLAARELLHCMICELRWTGRGKKMGYTNNGKISFTEIQFKERYGYQSLTYLKARNQLIECGLIHQEYRGGMCRGDRAKYSLLFIPGVPLSKQRWRDFPDNNYSKYVPKVKNQQIGKNTQWKKGVSGRKTKATLLKHTLNEANDPIKIDPKK